MLTARVYSVEEAYQIALQIERQNSGNTRRLPYNELERQNSGNTRRFPYTDSGNIRSTLRQPADATKGGAVGDNKGKAKAFGEGPQCYKCKGFGHFAVVCPTRDQRVAYVCEKDLLFEEEEDVNNDVGDQEEAESEEERLQATNLPICVIQRVLTGHKNKIDQVNHDWKRTNIFHTRVVHGNKALNVIIDNGSSMNVVAKEMVERLGLPQETHPTPYRVSWINDSSSVPVKHRCLVKFSLGKRCVNYDGLENTYSFKFQNRKIVLEPLPIAEFGSSKESNSMLTLRQVDEAVQAGTTLLFLVGRTVKELDGKVPTNVNMLLQEFQDLMPEELPQQLPPLRDIQHAIDLAEFAFNNSVNRTTGSTPFQLVYGIHPRTPLDIISLPIPPRPSEAGLDFAAHMASVHEEVRRKIALQTESYARHANLKKRDQQFDIGDLVMIRLRSERFPPGSYSKLHARRAGPFQVLKKLGPNAYVIDLPSNYTINPIFNVEDLTEFQGSNVPSDSMPEATIRLPSIPIRQDNIAAILDHQFVSTRRGGYYKFLVQWSHKPASESVWLQADEIKRLQPDLYHAYLQQNLPEASSSEGMQLMQG
ncbi:hypothetical protein LWI29_020549 [Acer saccharum]|uniref:CCHC-type domain-containing protein n=1 Tax=Acer saccharum TaxID=4024 RepID=A0AA39SMK5_ACESA|nr:hypothetical protein LWI29_020549 [Acer saccharum]